MKFRSSVFARCCMVMTLMVPLLVAIPGVAHASFIDVLSQDYSVQVAGGVTGIEAGDPGSRVSFGSTSDHPVFLTGEWSGRGGGASVSISAQGEVAPEYAWVGVSISRSDEGNAYISQTDVSASISFSPLVDSILVTTDSVEGMTGTMTLTDMTDGLLLFSWESGSSNAPPTTLALDLEHMYTMSFETDFGLGGYLSTLRIESVPEAPVPEPSTLLLSASGLATWLGAMAWRRRRRG